MWTCGQLKQRAKYSLTNKYWSALLASLIIWGITYAITWLLSTISSVAMFSSLFPSLLSNPYSYGSYSYGSYYEVSQFFLRMLPTMILTMVMSFLPQFFAFHPLQVGELNWYSRNRETPVRPGYQNLFCAFTRTSYWKVVGAMAYRYLFLFLWTLPALVPYVLIIVFMAIAQTNAGAVFLMPLLFLVLIGFMVLLIIASLRYVFIPWILADNPQIGYRRAMELSKVMTRGQIGHIFGLYLSFIPWYLAVLGVAFFTCGIGAVSIIFLIPYLQATYAELYAQCRHNAIQSGQCSLEELGFASPASSQTPPSSPNA